MNTSAIVIRDAAKTDARAIAELFRMSSDGVADYIWDGLKDEYPGLEPLDIGAQRYAREDMEFSYQNCLIAETDGRTAGMLHGYVMESDGNPPPDMDPVIRPYAELEVPGSYYLSGIAVYPEFQGRGIGTRFLEAAEGKARILGCPSLSLIVFEGNESALRLYERVGFTETDRRAIVPHEMLHHEGNALLMVKPVGGNGSTPP